MNYNTQFMGHIGSASFTKILGALVTEGVIDFAEQMKASWLVTDAIAVCKHHEDIKDMHFVTIRLIAIKEDESDSLSGTVSYEDGNGNILYEQEYSYIDLPEAGTFTMYFADNVLLLPNEY